MPAHYDEHIKTRRGDFMDKAFNKISDLDLAKLFFEKSEKEKIIADVFNFFEFDCLERCNVNPNELDERIKAFERSDYSDPTILAQIIGLIKNGKAVSKNNEEALVQKIKGYICDHLNDDITIEEIAEKLYISYYYMCHFFKSKTGVSVSAFRNQKRMELAIRQLLDTDKKISDIAVDCGFNDMKSFYQMFKNFTGCTPKAYRDARKKE